MGKFLWAGPRAKDKLHLTKWVLIMRPIEEEGWEYILDISNFNKELVIKNLWQEISGNVIWSRYMKVDGN